MVWALPVAASYYRSVNRCRRRIRTSTRRNFDDALHASGSDGCSSEPGAQRFQPPAGRSIAELLRPRRQIAGPGSASELAKYGVNHGTVLASVTPVAQRPKNADGSSSYRFACRLEKKTESFSEVRGLLDKLGSSDPPMRRRPFPCATVLSSPEPRPQPIPSASPTRFADEPGIPSRSPSRQ